MLLHMTSFMKKLIESTISTVFMRNDDEGGSHGIEMQQGRVNAAL